MMKRIQILAAGIAAASILAAQAGPYDQPWAVFEADNSSPTADTKPATVMKIDGKNIPLGRNNVVLPGKHVVELSIPGPRGMSNPKRDTIEIDAQPCVRYRFAARRSSPTDNDWKAFVGQEEPVGECKKKFAGK